MFRLYDLPKRNERPVAAGRWASAMAVTSPHITWSVVGRYIRAYNAPMLVSVPFVFTSADVPMPELAGASLVNME
jgi:hypothetical protein